MIYLHNSPGKGRGLFATRDIAIGERVIEEPPAISAIKDANAADIYCVVYQWGQTNYAKQDAYCKLSTYSDANGGPPINWNRQDLRNFNLDALPKRLTNAMLSFGTIVSACNLKTVPCSTLSSFVQHA